MIFQPISSLHAVSTQQPLLLEMDKCALHKTPSFHFQPTKALLLHLRNSMSWMSNKLRRYYQGFLLISVVKVNIEIGVINIEISCFAIIDCIALLSSLSRF